MKRLKWMRDSGKELGFSFKEWSSYPDGDYAIRKFNAEPDVYRVYFKESPIPPFTCKRLGFAKEVCDRHALSPETISSVSEVDA